VKVCRIRDCMGILYNYGYVARHCMIVVITCDEKVIVLRS